MDSKVAGGLLGAGLGLVLGGRKRIKALLAGAVTGVIVGAVAPEAVDKVTSKLTGPSQPARA